MTKLRLLLIPFLLAILTLSLAACSSDEMDLTDEAQLGDTAMDNSDDMEEMDDMDMGGGPEGLDTSTEKTTDNGLFQVAIDSNLNPIVLNEIHSWTVHVETADGLAVEGAQITVDGGMPEHNHGFPTAPEITDDLGDGDYLLEGVKFSMAGWWELKLNIEDGDLSDQVTFNLVVDDLVSE